MGSFTIIVSAITTISVLPFSSPLLSSSPSHCHHHHLPLFITDFSYHFPPPIVVQTAVYCRPKDAKKFIEQYRLEKKNKKKVAVVVVMCVWGGGIHGGACGFGGVWLVFHLFSPNSYPLTSAPFSSPLSRTRRKKRTRRTRKRKKGIVIYPTAITITAATLV
jgi:hypothetical protein